MGKEVVSAILASLGTVFALWLVGFIGRIPSVISVPQGAVVAFNLENCPNNGEWSEYKAAYGRFIRGIDRSGDGIDPNPKRTPGSFQNDSIKSHSHLTTIMVANNQIDGVDSTTIHSGDHHNETRPTKETGDKETRPKNVALLYCEKQ